MPDPGFRARGTVARILVIGLAAGLWSACQSAGNSVGKSVGSSPGGGSGGRAGDTGGGGGQGSGSGGAAPGDAGAAGVGGPMVDATTPDGDAGTMADALDASADAAPRVDAGAGGGAGDAPDARSQEVGGGGAGAVGGVAGSGGTGSGGAAGSAVQELIHYYGRWNRLSDRAITVNSGSHVTAQFTGSAVTARFDVTLNQLPAPTLAWRIDQQAWQEVELAAMVPLATGLPAGPHEVLLMVRSLNEQQSRWTPPLVSSMTFQGFEVAGGALQSSPRPLRPKIEFLGDSITEGVNVWPSRTGKDTVCWREDGRLAFASQTAQALGAEWRQVGFGRQGLLIGGNGGVPLANDAFNWIYQGVPRDAWQPDLVVINQGTNDRGADAAAFRAAYATFLGTIRAGYPNAKIAALLPFGGFLAAEIKSAVDARTAAGDARVFYIDTTGWLSAPADFTDSLHPNVQGSTKAAQALTAAIMTGRLLP